MSEKVKRKRKGERPDGLIQVSIQTGYKPDGRPERKYFYGHSRAEAERKRDEYKSNHAAGITFTPDIKVKEWVAIFKATYREGVNEAYLTNDDAPYNRLVKEIGNMRVADVRETHLQKALNKTSGMSFSTVSKYISTIKRVFRKARRNKIIQDDPAEDLARPTSTKGTHRALERREIELIFSHWNDEGVRAGLWVLLMLFCGLRRGELMALRWENIDMEKRALYVCEVAVVHGNQTSIESRAKTDAGLRILPICQTLYDALLAVPQEQRQGFVCLSVGGKNLSESAFSRGIEAFTNAIDRISNGEEPIQEGKRNDLKKRGSEVAKRKVAFSFRPHDLRHTYATMLYDAGVPVKAAQYFLGHSDVRITLNLYTHLSKERESTSRNQFVSYLDKWVDMQNSEAVKTASLEAQNEP